MNGRADRRAAAAVLAMFTMALSGAPATAAETSVFVPTFTGPEGLSRSVSTILRLQIWQSLRRATPGKGATSSFGSGVVKWGPDRLPALTHDSAEKFAHHGRVLSQMVLWGTVQEYGGGAIVQAFLSIPTYARLNGDYYADFRTQHDEEWSIRIDAGDKAVEFKTDVPRRRLAFEPIVIAPQVIAEYSSLNALVLYDPKHPQRRLGAIGTNVEALEQRGDSALVRSGGVTGIVKLPELSTSRSEIVDFVGGLTAIFRADWSGADGRLAAVAENANAPTEVRIDACLYRAFADAMLGRSGEQNIARAFALNAYADRTARFAIMETLARLARATAQGSPRAERVALLAQVRDLIQRHRAVFLAHDPWLDGIVGGLRDVEAAL